MKRRNAETGKMRRPVKRTKITEGMYGNSLLYLKFVMLWATVVLADYMLEFRFEFLWPFWMMLRSLYDSFKYQGIAFSVFFICIALTSDMICYFFIPLQYIFFAASTYVWVQYVWYTFVDKGICLPTVAMCCVLVYVEGALRVMHSRDEACRPLAAHCVGYPVVTLGFGVKSYVGHRLRLRRQRQVRAENDFYFQLMRDALPESALDQNQQPPPKEAERTANGECSHAHTSTSTSASTSACTATPVTHEARQMNGSVRRRCVKTEQNGHCTTEHAQLQLKLERIEKHFAQQTHTRERERDKSANTHTHTHSHMHTPASGAHTHTLTHTHAMSNGAPAAHCHHDDDDAKHDHSKGSAKSSKYDKKEANTIKEERRKKNRDKDSNDSHKSTEQIKEHIVKDKEVESTKESVKNKECNSNRDKEREKERERETREREKEREREREREREQRECMEELAVVKSELAQCKASEAEARRTLAAAAATERQRRTDHNQLKHAHAALQHKVVSWRTSERAALERRLGEERRARAAAEHQLRAARRTQQNTTNGECENEWCRNRRNTQDAEAASLRRELQLARDAVTLLQRELTQAADQVRCAEGRLEARSSAPGSPGAGAGCARPPGGPGVGCTRPPGAAGAGCTRPPAWAALSERAQHLERSLSAETRVKLDLLSALGDAQRKMHIQEGLITRQEKEIAELKAQMVAVMPTEYVTSAASGVSKLRRTDGSPLDPNASVYTPKQLCSDA